MLFLLCLPTQIKLFVKPVLLLPPLTGGCVCTCAPSCACGVRAPLVLQMRKRTAELDSEGVEALDRLLAQLSKVEVVDLGGEQARDPIATQTNNHI